jgi:hypothetical protein
MKWELHFKDGPHDGAVQTFNTAPTLVHSYVFADGAVYELQEPTLECCCTRYANYQHVEVSA